MPEVLARPDSVCIEPWKPDLRSRKRLLRALGLGAALLWGMACGGGGRELEEWDAGVDRRPDATASVGGQPTEMDSGVPPASTGGASNGGESGGSAAGSAGDNTAGASEISGGSLGSTGGSSASGGAGHESGGDAAGGGTAAVGGTSVGTNGGAGGDSSDDSDSEAAGGAPSIPLPDECEPQQATTSETSCSLSVSCQLTSDLARCKQLSSGRWQCACEFSGKGKVYEVSGAEGPNACVVAASLCVGDEPEVGDETCEERADGADANACGLTLACGRPLSVDFGVGVQAWLMDYSKAECVRDGETSLFECGCEYEGLSRRHGVIAASGVEACGALANYCRGEPGVSLDEPETCAFESSEASDEGCKLIQTCTAPIAILGEATISELGPRGAFCRPTGETTSACYCSGLDFVFSFEVEMGSNAGGCETSSLYCDKHADIQATGDATCLPTSLSSSQGLCDVDLDCVQPATVNGQPVLADGRLLTLCRQEQSGKPWRCSCASDQQTVTFEYGAPQETAANVCATAPSRCMELMPVHLGAYGEFQPPPDPLAPVPGD